MPHQELHIVIEDIFAKLFVHHGYVPPEKAARELAPNVIGDQSAFEKKVARELYRHPTAPHLFPQAEQTLYTLLSYGDRIRIWTDDYIVRIATSGLGRIRRNGNIPREQFGILVAEDKIGILPQALPVIASDSATIAFVDNNPLNLARVDQTIPAIKSNIPVLLIWLQSSADTHIPPTTQSPIKTIHSITDLIAIRTPLPKDSIFWCIDFNGTLVDTNSLEQKRKQAILEILTRPYEVNGSGKGCCL